MNDQHNPQPTGYGIRIEPLGGTVRAWRGDTLLAESDRARVMYETRLPPTVYFPIEDVVADLNDPTELQTFCPFKGTASYYDLTDGGDTLPNAVWSYADALPESHDIRGHVAFGRDLGVRIDTGDNDLLEAPGESISGPLTDWLLREAAFLTTPEAFTAALAHKMRENGISLSRLAVMIWSLHPLIAGKNYIWSSDEKEVNTFAPSYEIHSHPSFINSPLRHVSQGLGGVRQKLNTDYGGNSFPIMEDLRKKGATDYVAMPLPFSNGQFNVLTLTSDHPDGFTTANLGLVFECISAISRFYEVFMLKENAQSLLETYVGKRSGARVLGGEIRRGDGDEIDAAIMFCDLRHSTRLEQDLGRDRYIGLLNDFFEAVSTIVHDNGGEVLKFIGDAVLAVFPAGDAPDRARTNAVASAEQIVAALAALRDGGEHGEIDCSIGIDFGRVTYGNVGSRERLDFTVIGHAANVAARLGDYGKGLGHRVVVSDHFSRECARATPLGQVELRNVNHPVSCFAVA